jgi:hypothetical protein
MRRKLHCLRYGKRTTLCGRDANELSVERSEFLLRWRWPRCKSCLQKAEMVSPTFTF